MKSRRRIASPQGSTQGIVAAQTARLEVDKTALSNVRFGSKADILTISRHVRFTPKSGHWRATVGRPLCAIGGSAPFQERSRFEWNVSSIASRTLAVCWALPIDTVARSIFHQFHQPPSLPVRSGTWE
jgi:hypothetical protein